MKLKDGMVLGNVDGESFIVATGDAAKSFNGIIHNNEVASFIVKKLENDVTIDDLTKAVTDVYDVDATTAKSDIEEIIETLKNAGVLDY